MKITQKLKSTIAIVITAFICSNNAYAEYNHEIGLTGGTAFYLGDANHITVFHDPQLAVGGFYRYNLDRRWAFKLQAIYAKAAGNTEDFSYILPNIKSANFERSYVDVDFMVEFNFLDMNGSRRFRRKMYVSPYITLGLGVTVYNNMYASKDIYNFSIPFGLGVKWKINKRWNIGLEWTMHKMFTDGFDVTGSNNSSLDDPYQTDEVSFLDTDWYSIANLSVSFNLFNTKKFCP